MDYATAQDMFDALCAPFSGDDIEWRVGPTTQDKKKGQALCYVDARTVMDRLDAVCGVDGWENEYSFGSGNLVVCKLSLRMPDGTLISKCDGAGETDIEGQKGALSDALKRAAVRFGVGRYLYGLDAPWVELDDKRRIIPAARKELAELHAKEARRVGWGSPGDGAAYKLLVRVVQDTVLDQSGVIDFREKHKGMIPQLRVKARDHLEQVLDQIGGTQREAAE